jgi:hypothetical protein
MMMTKKPSSFTFVCPFCFNFKFLYLTKDEKYNKIVQEHFDLCESRRKKKIKRAIASTIKEYGKLLERLRDE